MAYRREDTVIYEWRITWPILFVAHNSYKLQNRRVCCIQLTKSQQLLCELHFRHSLCEFSRKLGIDYEMICIYLNLASIKLANDQLFPYFEFQIIISNERICIYLYLAWINLSNDVFF